ncbi:Uncharacterised protein [Mycobacteroides abscessus subsp. abscessus]|nr:Uncharacterised protein [Mycobacteroides abscessus subsp. abscessus]
MRSWAPMLPSWVRLEPCAPWVNEAGAVAILWPSMAVAVPSAALMATPPATPSAMFISPAAVAAAALASPTPGMTPIGEGGVGGMLSCAPVVPASYPSITSEA